MPVVAVCPSDVLLGVALLCVTDEKGPSPCPDAHKDQRWQAVPRHPLLFFVTWLVIKLTRLIGGSSNHTTCVNPNFRILNLLFFGLVGATLFYFRSVCL